MLAILTIGDIYSIQKIKWVNLNNKDITFYLFNLNTQVG